MRNDTPSVPPPSLFHKMTHTKNPHNKTNNEKTKDRQNLLVLLSLSERGELSWEIIAVILCARFGGLVCSATSVDPFGT